MRGRLQRWSGSLAGHPRAVLVSLAVAWIVTRALAVAGTGILPGGDPPLFEDIGYYHAVADHLARERTMPPGDMWQYPPGAAFLLLAPRALDSHYASLFMVLMLLVDALITVLLARRALRAGGSLLAPALWVLAMPGLRMLPVRRFDLVPTAFAVAALLVAERRPVLFGALVGLGTMVKAWPIALFAAVWDRRRFGLAGAATIVTCALVFAAAWWTFGSQAGFFDNQSARGLQSEAIAATPWHARLALTNEPVPEVLRSGALEIGDTTADAVAAALRWVTLAAVLAVAAWWLVRDRAIHRSGRADLARFSLGVDAAFVAVLLAVVTSRVLSPQFLIWLLGLAAVALADRSSVMRRPALTVGIAVVLTAGIYSAATILVVRNLVLVAAAIDASVLLVRALRVPSDRHPAAG